MKEKRHHMDYLMMFVIMIIASLLSTMNIWADKSSDIRFSLNDLYMAFLMTGWMFLFMGIIYHQLRITLLGLSLVILSIICIRTQFLISEKQFKLGMIPHHSMAVHMSKKLQTKKNDIQDLLKNIIETQEAEIDQLKKINYNRLLKLK